MVRTPRMLFTAVLLAAALSCTACSTSFPNAPATVGDDYPSGGIPVSVAWPSDWLEGNQHQVELSEAELAEVKVNYYDAAQLSGTYDTDTGIQSVTTVDALQNSGS